MITVKRAMCCGVLEVNGIGDMFVHDLTREERMASVDILWHVTVAMDRQYERCAFVMFSQNRDHTYGSDLKAYIEANNLGVVHTLPRTTNRNTGNMVEVFFWHVLPDALGAWRIAQAALRADKTCDCGDCSTKRAQAALARQMAYAVTVSAQPGYAPTNHGGEFTTGTWTNSVAFDLLKR